jgi:hypothetical protein
MNSVIAKAIEFGCPFFESGVEKCLFRWKACRDVSFVWPIPMSDRLGKDKVLVRPDSMNNPEDDIRGRTGYGILLSMGPGYWSNSSKCCGAPVLPTNGICTRCECECRYEYRFHPTTPIPVGSVVIYDKGVPWKFYERTPSGKPELVIMCGAADVKCVVHDYAV